ncbi:MAG: PPOX class F420-dependent oxidoreductase [Anaerolineae bacterium]|nr:PPOX class F420-dependent oxidoreductase [Anaerolineae bacterium]
MTLTELGNPTYIALETFRKKGTGVITPVWAVAEAGKLYVWTERESGKVKRISHTPQVRVCQSDARGTPQSDWAEAQARILADPAEQEQQRRRLAAKYGWLFRLIMLFGKLVGRGPYTVIEISARDR